MLGYYLEPEKTAETFTEDGYLRTGDKGEIDAEGYVRITGRLKEILKPLRVNTLSQLPLRQKSLKIQTLSKCVSREIIFRNRLL